MLKHFLILKSDGIPLFSISNGTNHQDHLKLDNSIIEKSELFSGFLSSMVTLGKEFGGVLEQIKLNNADLYTHENNNLIGVLLTEKEDQIEKTKAYKRIAEDVTKFFYSTYSEKLKNWNGEIGIFENFGKKLAQSDIINGLIDIEDGCTNCIQENICESIQKELTLKTKI
jgi:hypothetical protein